MYELVIFDCDGVLVDSVAIANEVFARLLTREGLSTTPSEADDYFHGALLADVQGRVEAKLGRTLPTGWIAAYELERAEAFRRSLKPIPGAAEAVRRVKAAGLEVCVASQGRLAKTQMTLGLTGLRDLFAPHALFSAHDAAQPKPHPALFEHAAATMNTKPSACVVVEDTPAGIAAALAAGMHAVGYAADSNAHALRDAGAEIINSLDELPQLLGLPRA